MDVISAGPSVAMTTEAGRTRVLPAANPAGNSATGHRPAGSGSPGKNGQVPAGSDGVCPAELTLLLTEDHDRIAHTLNDLVVRRLFAAGLDLQGALTLISDHLVAGKIERALNELDLAIRDLRETIFGRLGTRSAPPAPGGTAVAMLIPVTGADRRQQAKLIQA